MNDAEDSVDETSVRSPPAPLRSPRAAQDHRRRPLQTETLARFRTRRSRRALVQGFRLLQNLRRRQVPTDLSFEGASRKRQTPLTPLLSRRASRVEESLGESDTWRRPSIVLSYR